MNLNKVQIAGRLTKEPELKSLPSGDNLVSFSVASNMKWKDRDGNPQEKAEFHNVTFFGKVADVIAKYFVKGQEIYVEGRLETRKWEKEGQNHYTTSIIGQTFEFVGSAPNSESKPAPAPANNDAMPDYPEEEINPEDIPF